MTRKQFTHSRRQGLPETQTLHAVSEWSLSQSQACTRSRSPDFREPVPAQEATIFNWFEVTGRQISKQGANIPCLLLCREESYSVFTAHLSEVSTQNWSPHHLDHQRGCITHKRNCPEIRRGEGHHRGRGLAGPKDSLQEPGKDVPCPTTGRHTSLLTQSPWLLPHGASLTFKKEKSDCRANVKWTGVKIVLH